MALSFHYHQAKIKFAFLFKIIMLYDLNCLQQLNLNIVALLISGFNHLDLLI